MAEPKSDPRLVLVLDPGDDDDARTDELRRSLLQTLRAADVPGLTIQRTEAPAETGARGDAFTLGALALSVAPALVEQVVGIVRDWTNRPGAKPVKVGVKIGDREVSVEYDAASMSVTEMRAIVDSMTIPIRA